MLFNSLQNTTDNNSQLFNSSKENISSFKDLETRKKIKKMHSTQEKSFLRELQLKSNRI